jgi:hypothetical protein
MLDHCKAVAKRAGLDEALFDLKTFRSTYATRAGFGRGSTCTRFSTGLDTSSWRRQ